ncbi:transmembrane protein 164 isoform X2 [Orussus abietinus]|nr:transmembrane protein 164 isoform X2 [Orussus abietinus]
MNGPFLAYAFPETESRRIFADKALYYIQHALMVVIPYYLLRIGGPYTAEPLSDMSWCAFSFGLNMAYHFLFLQFMALPIQVNLSHILCPAILDPFGTENYRLWTLVHQGILCPLLCKFICATSSFFLTKFPPAKTEPTLTSAIQESSCNWDDNHSKESSKTSDLVSSSSQNSHKHVE